MEFRYLTFGDYYIEIVNDPSQTLPLSSQNQLIQQCTEISRESFQNSNLNYDGLQSCIIDASTSFFARDNDDQIVGFASYSLYKIDEYTIIYMQSSAVSTAHQSQGLGQFLISYRAIDAAHRIFKENVDIKPGQILIGGRTQSPKLYRFMNQKIGCFPNPDGMADPKIRVIARKFAKLLYDHQNSNDDKYGFQFNDKAFVTKYAYKKAYSFESASEQSNTGASIYASGIPFCEYDDEVNNFMKANLDWEEGDVITTLGYYNPDRVKKLLQSAKDHCNGHTKTGQMPTVLAHRVSAA